MEEEGRLSSLTLIARVDVCRRSSDEKSVTQKSRRRDGGGRGDEQGMKKRCWGWGTEGQGGSEGGYYGAGIRP
jgi:hypothetical protein